MLRTINRGFTLIELLIVIAVVGILAVGVATAINPIDQLQKGADTRRKTDLAEVQKALELYYHDNNRYPDSTNGEIRNGTQAAPWGGSFMPYMTTLPKDASSDKSYIYVATPNGSEYALYASLDRATRDTAVYCGVGEKPACSLNCGNTAICNFRVASSNSAAL